MLDDTNLRFGLNYKPTKMLEAHYGNIYLAGTILSNYRFGFFMVNSNETSFNVTLSKVFFTLYSKIM